MTTWTPLITEVGYLPQIFNEDDPRTAQEQANANYGHGGGWRSFIGKFTLKKTKKGFILNYPNDPPTHEVARAQFRDQTLVLFEHSWVAIIDADNALLDICRMD